METKKKPNWFFRILSILFMIYISLTIAMQTGYYEAKLNERTILTEENIKKFEEDVKNGKNVDINDYVVEKSRDFSNGTTKAGVAISHLVEKFFTEGITQFGEILKKLFT